MVDEIARAWREREAWLARFEAETRRIELVNAKLEGLDNADENHTLADLSAVS